MPYLFVFNMLVIFIAFIVSGNEITGIKKRMESLAKSSNCNHDLDIGRMWAAISDLQMENDQIKESIAKNRDSIVCCEKNLQEIDELLSDVATKRDLKDEIRPFNEAAGALTQMIQSVLHDDREDIQKLGDDVVNLHERLCLMEKSIKKPQSKKTEVSKSKKPAAKQTKTSPAS